MVFLKPCRFAARDRIRRGCEFRGRGEGLRKRSQPDNDFYPITPGKGSTRQCPPCLLEKREETRMGHPAEVRRRLRGSAEDLVEEAAQGCVDCGG